MQVCSKLLLVLRFSHSFAEERDDNIYALLTKREVKMAGYWPSSFFAFLWTETMKVALFKASST